MFSSYTLRFSPGQQGRRKVNIFNHRQSWIIAWTDRVCTSQYRSSCIKWSNNSSLCNWNRLLLHHLQTFLSMWCPAKDFWQNCMAKRSSYFELWEKELKRTSCNIVLAFSDILSNSSMQQIPLSLKTSAPLSKTCKITCIWATYDYHKDITKRGKSLIVSYCFSCFRILADISCQPNSRATSSTSVNTTRG